MHVLHVEFEILPILYKKESKKVLLRLVDILGSSGILFQFLRIWKQCQCTEFQTAIKDVLLILSYYRFRGGFRNFRWEGMMRDFQYF